jgi:4-aminobutyrate aminotransferase-like enzyme/Ser/Thr protein kinase RdoA (MazF antagonist)
VTTVRNAPRFTADDAARLASDLYGVEGAAAPLPSERDQNFRIGTEFVLKIANPAECPALLDAQNAALDELRQAETGLQWPEVRVSVAGERIVEKGGHLIRLLTWIPGVCFAEAPRSAEVLCSLGRAVAQMDLAMAAFDHPAAHREFHWDLRQARQARAYLPMLPAARRRLVEPIFEAWENIDWGGLPFSVIHGDANDYNVLVDGGGTSVVSVLDFGDMVYSATVGNLAVAIAYAMLGREEPIFAAKQVVDAYRKLRRLSDVEIDTLYPLAATRLAMSVCYCAWQASESPDNDYLNVSNGPAWALLEKLAALPEGWPTEVFRDTSPRDLLARRRRHLGPSLSISYREPLHIVRGWRQNLYDADGRAYLDCVNNVAHVGHSHPRVVRAAADQMARLNTNTRYLDSHLVEYIERLTATLPSPLSVVYLVCSGSEANELALRLARAHTGRESVLVVETAYHGNTNALIDISPYKFDSPGGRGKRPHVTVLPMPGRPWTCPAEPGAFICESALSCAGQVILPPGYLRDIYNRVRAAGGVCIADEVQTGFGRPGSRFWMFETQGVVPDIVTLGKPIGNGHPMGAVITTPEIAASFANGMEYFNTFGGNPVSCAIGLAVLDIIRDENLQENARRMGEYLTNGLRDLQQRRDAIRDVRGLGLFLGFDLPDEHYATDLVNRMKDRGVLLSTDGPRHNVIKMKPPMVFSQADADLLLERLDEALGVAES